MKASDAIEALKEFFLEILGFLIPGFILLFLTYIFLYSTAKEIIDNFINSDQSTTVIVVISYVCGYVLFGVSDSWRNRKRKNYPKWIFDVLRKIKIIEREPLINKLDTDIKKTTVYKISIEIIEEIVGIKKTELEQMNSKETRNIAMSFVPEADRKIYNFMFRAELSDKVGYALKIVSALGILSYIFNLISDFFSLDYSSFFVTEGFAWFFYLSLLIPAYLLRQTQKRFYGIAMRIVFPIFVAKFKGNVFENKKSDKNEKHA
jgi:hypothetical protein